MHSPLLTLRQNLVTVQRTWNRYSITITGSTISITDN
jgi:hypothetical protein